MQIENSIGNIELKKTHIEAVEKATKLAYAISAKMDTTFEQPPKWVYSEDVHAIDDLRIALNRLEEIRNKVY